MKIKRLILITISFVFVLSVKAQSTDENKVDYKTNPVWIKMIDNPNTNFYEAMKAYKMYWEGREKPSEEEEEMGELTKEKIREMKREERRNKPVDTKSAEEREQLVDKEYINYQNKRFMGWVHDVKPFVQEDGHILTEQERIDIWKKQQGK